MPEDVEEIVKREVAAARAILREDRIIAGHGAIKAKLDKHFPDEEAVEEDGKPKAPDRKPEKETTVTKKPGLWWGGTVPSE